MLNGEWKERFFHSPFTIYPLPLLLSDRFGFDDGVEASCVVVEVALVDAQEEDAVALGRELARAAYQYEVVVVVAYDGYERARRLVLHQLVSVGQGAYAC